MLMHWKNMRDNGVSYGIMMSVTKVMHTEEEDDAVY